MPIIEINSTRGALSDYEDKGLPGAFKFGSNLDVRKIKDTLSCQQALIDEGFISAHPSFSLSPSASLSPSTSTSPSISPTVSPSSSVSPSPGITSPSGSLSPSASRSPSGSASPSASLSPSTSISPSVSPSQPLTSVFRDLIKKFVDASDGNTYGFGNTGFIYKRDKFGNWFVVYRQNKQIKGAIERPQDNGKTYLTWMTDTEIHTKELPGLSNWNDVNATPGYPKTNLSSSDWHTAEIINGDMMICNGNVLAMIGYDGSYTNNALQLIPGNISRTLVERVGRVITGTYRSANTTRGVNAAIDTEFPLAQIGDDGDIYLANMVNAVPATRFPGGGKVNPTGVAAEVNQAAFFEWDGLALDFLNKQTVASMALWAVYGASSGKGGIYSYGRKRKNHPFVLNLDFLLDADELGALVVIEGLTMVSYRIGSTFGVKVVDSTTKAVGVYEGIDLKAPAQLPIKITEWSLVELTMLPLPTGCSVEFWYRIDKNGPFIQAKLADGSSNYSVVNGQDAVFSIGASGQIIEPKLVLNPSGNTCPEIIKTRIFFK